METIVPFDLPERRTGVHMASVVDGALVLAAKCGWRYAIAYLISERVPSPIIQRLLFGGGNVRNRSGIADDAPSWRGPDADDMKSLFDSLRQREPTHRSTQGGPPRASRAYAHYDND